MIILLDYCNCIGIIKLCIVLVGLNICINKQVNILISKNQALQILSLKHHNNEYKTS